MSYAISAQVRTVHHKAMPDLLRRRNVVACGLGFKTSKGQRTDELSLVVSVVRKLPVSQLAPEDLVPREIDGLRTDVIETGFIRAHPLDPRARWRPAQPGISIGHRDITAGTFGFLVEQRGVPHILSNNHVLANSNQGRRGDPIYQPGPADGGTVNDRVATLADFEPLDFGEAPAQCQIAETIADLLNLVAGVTRSSHRLHPVMQTPGYNTLDAALALPDAEGLVTSAILGIGTPRGVAEPYLGLSVQKMGRTTGLTQGMVTQVDVTVNVDFNGRVARFTDQVITSRMSNPGDSGSGIVDLDRLAVGLLFAGSEYVTIFTPISRVLERFEAHLVTDPLL